MLVAQFIVNNCLALRTASSVDFIKMVTYLRKGYKPPGKDRLQAILGGKLKTAMAEEDQDHRPLLADPRLVDEPRRSALRRDHPARCHPNL